MMKNLMKTVALAALLTTAALPVNAASSLDSEQLHLTAAARYLASHDEAKALHEYEAAITRNKESFAGWLGKANMLIQLKRPKEAFDALDEADDAQKGKDQKLALLRAQLEYAVTFKPDHWLSKAKEHFFKARRIDANRSDLNLWVARAYRDGGKRKLARKHYSKAIEIGGDDALVATKELMAMLRQEAASGTGKGVAGELSSKATIDRATLAAVLVERLHIQDRFKKRTTKRALPKDAQSSPFAAAIETMLNLNINSIALDPHGNFLPKQSVTRFELALLAQEYLVAASGNNKLYRAFIGTKSPFPDLSANHYAFNAAFLAVSRGLMAPTDVLTGKFDGNKAVSGVDLMLLLNRLGDLGK
ncbi:MAG: hypothetical protein Q9M26_04475 [Mariprofundales bacterium]|nr:hypothetical protein [Mariprofundales bacterium]